MEEFILILKYIFLGLFQGFTEPIPISSSGHVAILQELLGLNIEGLSFELFVNSASLLAVLLIYKADIIRLATNGIGYIVGKRTLKTKTDFHFIVLLIVATIPAGLVGVLFSDQIADIFKGAKTIGGALLITGIALWLIRNVRGKKSDRQLTFMDAVIIGLAQMVALIPGISRSGATLVAALARGTHQETALRFSFLLYIPVSLGGMLLGFSDLVNDPMLKEMWFPYLCAFYRKLWHELHCFKMVYGHYGAWQFKIFFLLLFYRWNTDSSLYVKSQTT